MFRIGHAYDLHRLVLDRPLILGGVKFDHPKGLLGHSDADCLLHAIAEALLGALALGDLGTHFPDNDPKYLNIDSKIILKECYKMVKERGYEIVNIDTTIYAERPKIKPYSFEIRQSISDILDIEIDKISVKATTHEKLGPIGLELAIASEAVCLLCKNK